MGDLSHQEVAELLGAYALDAVDPDEAELVEAHLATCPRCRTEVEGHREVAAMLAHAGAPAPPGVWDRIAATLEEPPPRLDLAPVQSLDGRRTVGLRTVAAIVSVAAAVIALLGFQVVRQDQRIDAVLAGLEREGLQKEIAAALVDPTARKVRLVAPDGSTRADAVLRPDGRGYLVDTDLPELPPGRTYQLWAQIGDQKVSLGLLGPKPRPAAFQVMADVAALAVTEEVAQGVAVTSNPAVASGWVPGRAAGR